MGSIVSNRSHDASEDQNRPLASSNTNPRQSFSFSRKAASSSHRRHPASKRMPPYAYTELLREGEKLLMPVETVANEVLIIDGTAYHRTMIPEGLLESYEERYREQQDRLRRLHEQRNRPGSAVSAAGSTGKRNELSTQKLKGDEHYTADQVQSYHHPTDSQDDAHESTDMKQQQYYADDHDSHEQQHDLPSVKRKGSKLQAISTIVTPIRSLTGEEDEDEEHGEISHPSTPQDTCSGGGMIPSSDIGAEEDEKADE